MSSTMEERVEVLETCLRELESQLTEEREREATFSSALEDMVSDQTEKARQVRCVALQETLQIVLRSDCPEQDIIALLAEEGEEVES